MVPIVIAAILLPEARLKMMGKFATVAIIGGFVAGWMSAAYGKYTQDSNLIFLAPVASLGVSTTFLLLGLAFTSSYSANRRPKKF